MYKYFCMSDNKSAINWTFCQLLVEKPNSMRICDLTFFFLFWTAEFPQNG
jgi:hypothetical protein